MVKKAKSRSKSQKPKSKSQKVIKKSQKKQASKNMVNQKKLTRSDSKQQSQSQIKKGKSNKKVAPVKKKITKGKKQQIKKKPTQKTSTQQKVVSQSKTITRSAEKSPNKSNKNQKQIKGNKKIKKEKQQQQQQKQKPKSNSQKKSQSKEKSQNKKKEKSYFEILYDYITTYDKQHEGEVKSSQNEKRPYQLMEDIKIIYSVAQDDKHEGLGPVFWNELANKKVLQRPVESMRDRYKRYIRFLDKNDFDQIIKYLREQGTEGYMVFSKGDNGNRKLINIQLNDPTIKIDYQQEQQTKGIHKPKEDKSLELLHNILQKRQEMKGKKQQLIQSEEKLFPLASDSMSQNFKKIAVQSARPIIKQNERLLSAALLEELPAMKQMQSQAMKSLECISQTSYKISTNFAGHRFTTSQKIADVNDLNSVVNMLHFQFNKARQEIIDDLQDVNGNIQSLIQIYQNPNENPHLKWTAEDDNILKQCKTKDDISLKLLIRYKGEESVRNRIKFKKFQMPFSI